MPLTTEEAYQILGLDRQADARAVKLAYRRRALEWHPDRRPAGADPERYDRKFRELRAAYEHLRREGFPELLQEPVPEPDWGPRVAGRSFATRESEDIPFGDKLGLKPSWNLESVLLWGLVMPGAALIVILMAKYFLTRMLP